MEATYYSPEKRKESMATIKKYIKTYSYVVECLLTLKDVMKSADTKRLMKKQIDKINSLLPEKVYIVLDLQKEWWLDNTIKLWINTPEMQDENGSYLIGNCFKIYPTTHINIYLAKDRTFDYDSFCQAIDRLIEIYQKNVSEYTRALTEFSKWSRKMNKLVELTKEIKKDAPEYFRFSFPNLKWL